MSQMGKIETKNGNLSKTRLMMKWAKARKTLENPLNCDISSRTLNIIKF